MASATICQCGDHAFRALGRHAVALASPQDAALLSKSGWKAAKSRKRWYVVRRVDGGPRCFESFHAVVGGACGALQTDHRNLNGLDNRRPNLRPSTARQNAQNRGPRKDNPLGLKGVSFNTKLKRWGAYITVDGRMKRLGHYSTPEEAARAYDTAAVAAFGDFARTNSMEARTT